MTALSHSPAAAATHRFQPPLRAARLRRRYKRFLADVELSGGDIVTAHCPNPGAMTGLAAPGSNILLAPVANPKAKLRWRWVIASEGDALVGVDTGLTNGLAATAVAAGVIPELRGYRRLSREVTTGAGSRIDLLLQSDDKPDLWVEVKSVTLRRGEDALFPDAATKRGVKHLGELTALSKSGARAAMLYLAQRADCRRFAVAADIDPDYAEAFAAARRAGVEMLCWDCTVSAGEIRLRGALPVIDAEKQEQAL